MRTANQLHMAAVYIQVPLALFPRCDSLVVQQCSDKAGARTITEHSNNIHAPHSTDRVAWKKYPPSPICFSRATLILLASAICRQNLKLVSVISFVRNSLPYTAIMTRERKKAYNVLYSLANLSFMEDFLRTL
ncbi:hypothetical protein EDD16DRAFT_492500 [Pisolithus croceorrhizus]|nr:hypothetical protein EDD16DRAFT_492500 [Pisolithus croceorrhizus]KAI6142534.1 hypothetical protein EDD17DRAFT_238299 [Pisolithus thermaeus]